MSAAPDLDHLFRHAYGKITAMLAARFSPRYIELIEDAVQEALVRAMQTWGYGKAPDKPEAWIYRVASNVLIDRLRRESRSADLEQAPVVTESDEYNEYELGDEQLRMIFACCHPAIKMEEQLMLSLKLLCGLSTREIARALLRNPEAVKKAITRAREKFRTRVGKLEIPEGEGMQQRLEAVLRVLYLMFNEGYSAAEGSDLVRRDLCEEALRLGFMLGEHPSLNQPDLKALMALMCFHYARFDARLDGDGNLVTLPEQDRTRWNYPLISAGQRYLFDAFKSDSDLIDNNQVGSEYHWLALIAAHYTTAQNYAETDFPEVLAAYDRLMLVNPSPIVAMNRVVVVREVHGQEKALEELEALAGESILQNHHLYFAIRADLEEAMGRHGSAVEALKKGIECTSNEVEKRFFQAKIEKIVAS
jgi:RNA polymerase sigma-70 factor (ECF subfamily)